MPKIIFDENYIPNLARWALKKYNKTNYPDYKKIAVIEQVTASFIAYCIENKYLPEIKKHNAAAAMTTAICKMNGIERTALVCASGHNSNFEAQVNLQKFCNTLKGFEYYGVIFGLERMYLETAILAEVYGAPNQNQHWLVRSDFFQEGHAVFGVVDAKADFVNFSNRALPTFDAVQISTLQLCKSFESPDAIKVVMILTMPSSAIKELGEYLLLQDNIVAEDNIILEVGMHQMTFSKEITTRSELDNLIGFLKKHCPDVYTIQNDLCVYFQAQQPQIVADSKDAKMDGDNKAVASSAAAIGKSNPLLVNPPAATAIVKNELQNIAAAPSNTP